ncbi:MAG: MaoC family dehydratase N-terminal domain-containing protein [Gammaproteobacteria bacterium]|nr:MaoC family dehydratase N-terminal domain-containing protein [Gammaproteobacteria bacterium]
MLDRKFIGYTSAPCTLEVEKGRLRLFAIAIGQADPVYSDEAAARAAGHRSLPVPPTFLFCLEMDRPNPYGWFDDVGIPLPKVLHGEQQFTYHRMAYAGDQLTFTAAIVDIYDKKGGLLEFVVQDNQITNQHQELVAEFRRTIVVRHG